MQDRVSGATELEKKMRSLIRECHGKEDIIGRCKIMLSTYPSMGSLWQIANIALLHGNDIDTVFTIMEHTDEKIAMHGAQLIRSNMVILTYSRSSLVSQVLRACVEKNIRVFCGESRPNYEGRILAKELGETGIDVTFMTDATLFSHVCQADMLILGADAIVKKGIVNKIGTSALITLAHRDGIPTYVVSSSYKAFPFVFVKEESSNEIWKNAPGYVKVKNRYFDITPHNFITAYVTETGISASPPLFRELLADEIIDMKKSMLSAFMLVE